jgi:hypothetical protein
MLRRFPIDAWDDPSRWDVTGLDPLVQRFDQNFGDWTIDIPRPTWAVWFGDTWRMHEQFTVNYGVRWDADWGALDPPHITTQATFDPAPGWVYPGLALEPGAMLYPNNLRDLGSVAPRGGFTWNVGGNGNFVIRGGSGLYYSIPDSNTTFSIQSFNGERILVNSFANDRLPGFIADPTRGRTPEDYLSGRYPVPPQGPRVIAHDYQMPSTWQSIVGVQAQLGPQLGVEGDFTHWKGYHFARQRDPNLFFDPATGYNRNPSTAGRPDPKYGQIQWLESNGRADYAAISSALTRRYANNWQASLAYTLMLFMHDNTNGFQSQGNNPFDPEAEWARSTDFQRHTVRLNGIWRLPYDFTLSGAYLFGSGNYYATTIALNPYGHTGTTRLNSGATALVIPETIPVSSANTEVVNVRDRFDGPSTIERGAIAPRNALRGLPLHRVDVRVSKDLNLPGATRLTGIFEVFNLTNHANYGAYNGQINSPTFGQPRQNLLNAYQPRVVQLAFKFAF